MSRPTKAEKTEAEKTESAIAPPPSLEAILSSAGKDRLGGVDFTARLAREPEPEPEPQDVAPTDPEALRRSAAGDEHDHGDAEGDDAEGGDLPPAASAPAILPVAKLDAALAAELPKPRPVVEAEEAEAQAEAEAAAREAAAEEAAHRPEPAAADVPAEPLEAHEPRAESPAIEEPADFATVPVSAVGDRSDQDETPSQAAARAEAEADARAEAEVAHQLDLTVQQVADEVVSRMRAAGEASRRHVESIEAEAARRCELLTAQAELDAELIRLHARREAHAIITAARMRAGGGTGTSADSQRLHEIGETFSRFAESIESTVAQAPGTPDHPQTP